MGMMGIVKSYGIGIAEPGPRPVSGKRIRRSDYRLKLAIQVAQ